VCALRAAEQSPARPPAAPSLPAAPTSGELRNLSAWAFDYERLIIEVEDAGDGQRERALHILSMIVTLVGHVRLCDVDDDLVRSVRRMLATVLEGVEAAYAGRLWAHFVGWSRYHAAPEATRTIWLFLDADVDRVDDLDR
jgi:hypothetical protein